jgi:S1-C subfamily serine protease
MYPDPVPPLPEPVDAAAPDAPQPPKRFRRARAWSPRVVLFGSGVAAAFIAVLLYGALFPPPAPLTQQDVTSSIAKALASQTPGPALSEQAYAAIQPSLVLVEAANGGTASPAPGASQAPTASPGPSAGAGAESGALGSGVIIDDAGDIMTSLHVVANATAIMVTFADGTRSPARITTREPAQDIAVLQATQPPATITPATLGDPGSLRIGSEAYVVGNPFGLYGSMSAGVVSGLGRTFQEPNGGPLLSGLIQVDAAVNPGNSGGPLIDRNGRVLGIVTGLVNPTKQDVFIGIGLAVPIDAAGGPAGLPQY